jgi:hypothetical protein
MRRVARQAVSVLVLGAVLIAAPTSNAQNTAGDTGTDTADGGKKVVPSTPQRRDPFRPFTLDMRLRQERLVQLTPLQRYELGQLAVVATVWDVNPPRAMVEDSAGMGYIVSLGTPIGNAGGVVTGIEPQRIIVEERVLDYYGKEQVNRIVMETPKAEGPSRVAQERQ